MQKGPLISGPFLNANTGDMMKTVTLVVWVLAASGAFYLALGLIGVFGIIDYAQLHVPNNVSAFEFALRVLGQFANLLTFALSGIALALALTYVGDVRDISIRRWAEVRPIEGKLSIGECLSLLLKISATLLIVVGLIQNGKASWEEAPDNLVLIGVSITARILLGGLSAFAVALLLDKMSATSARNAA